MSWKTWGSGRVDVPSGSHSPFSFLFCGVVESLKVDVDAHHHGLSCHYRLMAAWPTVGATHTAVVSEFTLSGGMLDIAPKELVRLTTDIAVRTAQYTAAHILSNIAAVIANYPMSPEAKNQIIAALVMALPNFDDSEACKSPVGKHLVRTREDFMHAAVSARFRHSTTPVEYKAYSVGMYDTTEVKRWIK